MNASADSPQPAPPVPAGPDHRDLYLLIAGLLLGLLLGPAVLGRINPDLYRQWFLGGVEAQQKLAQFEDENQAIRLKLLASGASEVAAVEFDQQIDSQRQPLIAALLWAQEQRAQALRQLMHAFLLVLAVVMVLEAALAPSAAGSRARLASARYALMAIWLALLLAQPALLKQIPWIYAGGMLAITLLVALIPLGAARRRA